MDVNVSRTEDRNTAKKKMILPLQAWRGIFIIMIFVLHVCPELIPFLAGGNECISFFVILSGFCLTLSNKKYDCSVKGIASYSFSRTMKFYPLYCLVLFCFTAENLFSIIVSHNFANLLPFLFQLLVSILLLQAFVPGKYLPFELNGPAWYLSATSFFYVVFIPILTFVKKTERYILGIIFALFALHIGIVIVLQGSDNFSFWTYYFPPFRCIEFAIGICLGLVFKQHRNTLKSVFFFSIIEITVIVLFVFHRVLFKYTDFYSLINGYYSLIAIVIAVSIIYTFSFSKGIVSKVLSNKLFVFIGNISFEIYIVHALAVEGYFLFFKGRTNIYLKTIIVIFFTAFIISGYKFLVYLFKKHKSKNINKRKKEQII